MYAPAHKRLDFQVWKMPSHAFYPREWALAWEGIDFYPPRDPATAGRPPPLSPPSAPHLPPARRYYPDFKPERMVYPDKAVAAKKDAQKRQAQAAA